MDGSGQQAKQRAGMRTKKIGCVSSPSAVNHSGLPAEGR